MHHKKSGYGIQRAGKLANKKHCFRSVMDEVTARMLTSLNRPGGAVAQLGARLDGIEEVVGSNPIGSTKFRTSCKNPRQYFYSLK